MSETDKTQKTRVIGYIEISALQALPEWQKYAAAVSLAEKSVTKTAVRELIKKKLEISEEYVLDFIKYDASRIQVFLDLQPKKAGKRRGNDLSDLFAAKPEKPDR